MRIAVPSVFRILIYFIILISLDASAPLKVNSFRPPKEPKVVERLEISSSVGIAPHEVTIVGSPGIVERIERCAPMRAWVGHGNDLFIDWGDGSMPETTLGPNESCADMQERHIYSVPGTYRLRATIAHPGPDDGPVIDWRGEADVTVTGEAPPDSLIVHEPEERIFTYNDALTVKWNASVAAASELRVEAITQDGAVIRTEPGVTWSTSGPGEQFFRLQSPAYDAALRRGEGIFRLRVSLIRAGTIVAGWTSKPLRMTARLEPDPNWRPKLQVLPNRDLKVVLGRLSGRCDSYRIVWDDGETTERHAAEAQPSCNKLPVEFSHSYREAGSYAIRIFQLPDYENRRLDEVVSYIESTADIP